MNGLFLDDHRILLHRLLHMHSMGIFSKYGPMDMVMVADFYTGASSPLSVFHQIINN